MPTAPRASAASSGAASVAVVRPAGDHGHDTLRGVAFPEIGTVAGGERGAARTASTAPTSAAASWGSMSRFVSAAMVTGRSVVVRNVRQGTPSIVVSSWTPPESVSTRRAPSMSCRKSRESSGSVSSRRDESGPAAAPPPACSPPACSPAASCGSPSRAPRARVHGPPAASARRCCAARPRQEPLQGIDHGVADEVDPGGVDALAGQVLGGAALRGEQQISGLVGGRRLSSSGMVRSPLRRPASTCATGMRSFVAQSAAASVELTSPTTTARSGCSCRRIGSRRSSAGAVCAACEHEPRLRRR